MHPTSKQRQKVAVIGAGVAGLTAAYLLSQEHDVTVFEKNDYMGGHTNTVEIPSGPDQGLPVDTGFIVYNDRNYPTFIRLLKRLGVEGMASDMSFGVTAPGLEYSSYVPFGLFAQKRNWIRPSFLKMVRDITRFNRQAIHDLSSGRLKDLTLGDYVEKTGAGAFFKDYYLFPMTAAIWSTSPREMRDFPAEMFARFFLNHGLLALRGRPQWKTIPGGARCYVRKILESLEGRYHLRNPAGKIFRTQGGVTIVAENGARSDFDAAVIATHADEALRLLGDASPDEKRLLGAWTYTKNVAVLHTDRSVMPRRQAAWASWNYTVKDAAADQIVAVSYHMNRLQSLKTKTDYFVTLNPGFPIAQDSVIREIQYTHPRYTFESLRTQAGLVELNGKNKTYFCGSYFYNGFHEDAVKSAVNVALQFGAVL